MKDLGKRLEDLEESIRSLDKSVKDETRKQRDRPVPPPPTHPIVPEVEVPHEKPIIKPSENKQSTNANNRCVWRDSSPMNTTFEVKDLIYLNIYLIFYLLSRFVNYMKNFLLMM